MWTTEQIERDLPRIRKVVEDVHYDIHYLYFTTKAWSLKHTRSFLPLSRVTVMINRVDYGISFRYTVPFFSFFHWHPTLLANIGPHRFRNTCLGKAEADIKDAWPRGVYETVLAVLCVLQTITPEDGHEWDSASVLGLETFMVAVFAFLICSVAFTS